MFGRRQRIGVDRVAPLPDIPVHIKEAKRVGRELSHIQGRVARKIEREANYPGQIRVSVIRETRMVEHAR